MSKGSLSNPSGEKKFDRTGEDRRKQVNSPPGGIERRSDADRRKENNLEYVSFSISGQLLGIPVLSVQEILPAKPLARVPLAPKVVQGLLNLRGQIVTAVDLRERLQFPPREPGLESMSIVVENQGELFSLIVDSVGDVISVRQDSFGEPPATLDDCWRSCCQGVHRLQKGLLVIVDVQSLLTFGLKI